MTSALAAVLDRSGLPWTANAPLKRYCTWQIGGPADWLVEPCDSRETQAARDIARRAGLPCLVIGHGSNMLFDDAGFRGMVVKLGSGFGGVRFEGAELYAGAGVWVPSLARACASRGLSGLEHAAGIPGNLGGLVYMNGGSMRKDIGSAVVFVDVLDGGNRPRRLTREECGFSYRRSIFQQNGWIVTGARLRLTPGDPETVRREMLDLLEQRRHKFPLELPNCGSVFSNDEQLYAQYGPPGMVIDRLGLKGTSSGGAQVSLRHANFIVNRGGASSGDVFALVRLVRSAVYEKTGFLLKCEVRYAAPDGRCAPLHEFL